MGRAFFMGFLQMTQEEFDFDRIENDSKKYHRSRDKKTAIQSAKEIIEHLPERRRQFLVGLAAIGGVGTAREVAAAISNSVSLHDSIRRRATDMARLGLVEEIEPRECRISGKKVTVYRIKKGEG